ncbi:CotY/CotZ family spore coat protein [Salirhabdus salicampi]|uniref:CotY/CotZ family spore coat protein n=1 Tax=Salirhabdus salicampi TaxID=476102 RepID=UPI0020C4A6F0|nr:CotY/CotZ family spore coat protein [Salirhabdus salicampi]MCP8616011.1 CotY/CotZ family spore coat protein [Salirhabdus salicampi]
MSHRRRRDDDDRIQFDDTGNCVCDVVRAIADAQDNVVDECDVSCRRSINNLVSPVNRNNLNTVPFILYGKELEPFRGFGVDLENDNGTTIFDCIDSFIFRVNSVDDDCCATLELLTFDEDQPDAPGDQAGSDDAEDPCEQLEGEDVRDLRRTGVCITVDLTCFCAISCLPAVDLR